MDASPIQSLIAQHRSIAQKCAALIEMLEQPQPGDLAALAEARWALASTVLLHLPAEDRAVFNPLLDHPDPAVSARAASCRAELDSLFSRYRDHVGQWTNARIERDWDMYRQVSLELLPALRTRMETEERELYPQVLTLGTGLRLRRPADRNWAGEAATIRADIGQSEASRPGLSSVRS